MTVITDSHSLAKFCDALSHAPYIAIDTEFLREKTYWPQLCLVQVAGPDEGDVAAIDPLAPGIDLEPLFRLLSNPNVVKVFHAARQDVEIFLKLTGVIPYPLFDTQVAAMVCGFGESVSYETLATSLAKVQIDKSMRFTDWSARPLSERQLNYALSDVIHLRVVYEKLLATLDQTNRRHWLEEELAILATPTTYRVNPEEAWKRLKPRSSSPRFLGILKELAAWRERAAQGKDIPRQRIIKDETLLDIAAHAPKTVEALARARGLGKGIAEGRMGEEIIAAILRGLALPEEQLPRLPDRSETVKAVGAVTELLKVFLKMRCDEVGVASKMVASASDLEAIALDDNADSPALHGWRRGLFGEDALKLKHGRIGLALSDDGRKVRILHLTDDGTI